MKHPTKICVLTFVAAAMMGMPCMARDESHSSWKRLPDMAVPRTVLIRNLPCGYGVRPELPLALLYFMPITLKKEFEHE